MTSALRAEAYGKNLMTMASNLFESIRTAWNTLHGLPHVAYPFKPSCECYEVSDVSRLAENPVVSVVVAVWNHAPYLHDAIEGCVGQVADFPYEILLCEDCSPDDSRAVCLEAQRKYPDKVRVLYGARNLGGRLNFFHGIDSARGTYIALLEGDDFWIEPKKLQLQVDAMRRNRTRMCMAWNEDQDERSGVRRKRKIRSRTELNSKTFHKGYYHTSTYVFEKTLWKEVLPYFEFIPFYDNTFYPLALAVAERISILPKYVSVYRQTGRGCFTGLSKVDQARMAVSIWSRLVKLGHPGLRRYYQKTYFNSLVNVAVSQFKEGRCTVEALLGLMIASKNAYFVFLYLDSWHWFMRLIRALALLPFRCLVRHCRALCHRIGCS